MMNAKENIEAALSRSVCGGWDRDFLESILEQTTKGKALTPKQNQTLGNVLARNTPEAQTEHEGWSTSYESDFKDNALILAKYHLRQPYYKPMATDIIEGKVPERRKFLRMYENKYSKKVLAQSKSEPKYSVGDYINTRAAFKGRGGFILEIDRNIYSPAKGAKRYKILPIGCTTPLIIEERYIKLNKKRR